ncbi:MAG TPA: TIGR00730 family Rossman fold protein [Chloroflexia bacterium]|nr:TIGR00730 family Rossman fold protein [Chloroflexia bacterium]
MIEGLEGKGIAVYCASSSAIDSLYFEAARRLGILMGQSRARLVYGGTNIGLMGAVAGAVLEHGGEALGVIPALINAAGIAHPELTELILTDGMRERKAIMEERAEAYIALPGGYGTLEEIFEILTLKQLGYHQKAVVLLNINRYYDPLLALLGSATEQRFMKPSNLGLFHLATTPEEALEYIASYQPGPAEAKWLPPKLSESKQGEVPGTE